jgi:hypothetical protein
MAWNTIMFNSLKDAYNQARNDPGQFGEAAKKYIADYTTNSEEEIDDKLFYIMRFANNILPHLPAPSNKKRLWNEVDDFIIKNKGSGSYYLDNLSKNNIIPSYKIFKDFMTDASIHQNTKNTTAKLIYQSMIKFNYFWDEPNNADFRQSMPEAYSDYYNMVLVPIYDKEADDHIKKSRISSEFDVLESLNRSINMLLDSIESTKEYQNL